ncbi:Clp protease ClpP [Streptococcus chenjunshii]|uniref:ATP-dependent Clp protease proteolytic subunit n=1 Tax=Streptococcus chenjunshii TaxID=2173853 RepID=A0A372KLP8_9STRE|nr:head maturation protease, ClpP-related [Streptococcus chenjunshii]AXQ79430.1 Clp protease ClpP [Streptococcus chenjunshii]RFU51113.1 Clp protease ClpP [Streptococcus chenjunshii]RFU53211.1 Clp protease ClpP [Streptococcus chenjunshii]
MKIDIKGTIVSNDVKWFYDEYGLTATAPKDIVLPENGEPVEVIINSGGGDVFAGSEIYTALRDYSGAVSIKVVGIAASAASVIAMAGDSVEISPTAQMMIHNVSTVAEGDHRELKHEAEILENYNKSIANAYILKTGLSPDELLDLMAQETWLSAGQAVEKGFADKVMFAEDELAQLVAAASDVVPNQIILAQKLRSEELDRFKREVSARLDNLEKQLVTQNENEKEPKEEPKGFKAFLF